MADYQGKYSGPSVDKGVGGGIDWADNKNKYYTKTEVDSKVGEKADKSTIYTKTEIDTKIGDIESLLSTI